MFKENGPIVSEGVLIVGNDVAEVVAEVIKHAPRREGKGHQAWTHASKDQRYTIREWVDDLCVRNGRHFKQCKGQLRKGEEGKPASFDVIGLLADKAVRGRWNTRGDGLFVVGFPILQEMWMGEGLAQDDPIVTLLNHRMPNGSPFAQYLSMLNDFNYSFPYLAGIIREKAMELGLWDS
jgi:hypothetical protein